MQAERRALRPGITKKWTSSLFVIAMLAALLATTSMAEAETEAGTNTDGSPLTDVKLGSLIPVYKHTGKITLSTDGLGTNAASGVIDVEKPAGATVRAAYVAAASSGFSGQTLAAGDVKIDGVGFAWDITTPSSINSSNSWADVTSLVKAKIDAAPAGRVGFTIAEVNTFGIDGEILTVVFDDPSQPTTTVVLMFGAQHVLGDTFAIALGDPIDKSDPNLVLDMSLGISFGFQGSNQYSQVDVNGARMTTSAGGQDDGQPANGALLTVGGLDDSNANPANPLALPTTHPRYDDELYDLRPFVNTGDTAINVFTRNPSNDDNIYFGALRLTGNAIVGEGVVLSPLSATNPVGTTHTVTATVQNDTGQPVADRVVTFTVVNGPQTGTTGTGTTGSDGKATFTYTGLASGTDVIEATFVDNSGVTRTSARVTKTWEQQTNQPPTGNAGGPYTGSEGTPINVDGTAADGDGDTLTYSWSQAGGGTFDAGASCTFTAPNALDTSVTCDDDGVFNLALTINDGTNPPLVVTTTATVANVYPTVDITAPPDGTVVAMGTQVNLASTFGDAGGNDLATMLCSVDWDNGAGAGAVTPAGSSCSATNTYTAAGVYAVSLTADDQDGGTATDTVMLIVYDPSAGFVTGGGWINSPAGAYQADPTLAGKANFGFVSKYKKGANTPTGETEFQFQAASFRFHSASYQWLVVSGAKAQYKGAGTVNGVAGYSFLLTATDGQVTGGGGTDKFRIKVWETATGDLVYDNVKGSPDTLTGANPQNIGGGSVVIHK